MIKSCNKILLNFSLPELQGLGAITYTEIRVLSKGIYAKRLDVLKYTPNTCYFDYANSDNGDEYLICIAFDEMQPMIYKAQLIAILKEK